MSAGKDYYMWMKGEDICVGLNIPYSTYHGTAHIRNTYEMCFGEDNSLESVVVIDKYPIAGCERHDIYSRSNDPKLMVYTWSYWRSKNGRPIPEGMRYLDNPERPIKPGECITSVSRDWDIDAKDDKYNKLVKILFDAKKISIDGVPLVHD